MNSPYPYLRGQCDEACLELGLDPIPKQTISYVLQGIGRKYTTYENSFPRNNKAFLSENQLNYVEDIIIKRDTSNLAMSKKKVIQVISELGQAKSLVAEIFEKDWEGGCSSGNDYIKISDLCVTTVSLAHHD